MSVVNDLLGGLETAVTLQNLLFLLIGVMLGIIVGILPGLGPTAGIAILIPLTLGMDATTAVIMLAAIYYGAMYGGSITAILINLPGESSSVAATFDGYPLAQQGRVGPALVMQACANFIGGILGVILLTALIQPVSRIARSFGPSELFLIVLLGLVTIVGIVGRDKVKGAISMLFGLALGTVGIDLTTGASRLTFGQPSLLSGLSFVAIVIGLFGVGEVLHNVMGGDHRRGTTVRTLAAGRLFWPSRQDWRQSMFTFPRATVIGFIVGVVALGLWQSRGEATKGEQSTSDYFLAGRGLTWWLIGFSLIAANISTEQFVACQGRRPTGWALRSRPTSGWRRSHLSWSRSSSSRRSCVAASSRSPSSSSTGTASPPV